MLPPPQLADYVRFFWFLEGNATIDKPFVHHAFAYHCPEFVFCYKGQFSHRFACEAEGNLISGIYGQTQTFARIASDADFGVFGFYVYPYALAQLFRLPANEFTGQSVDMKTFYGRPGVILEEKIMLATDNDQRFKLVCDFLEAQLKNVRPAYTGICTSIKSISNCYQGISVKSLAANNFLSLRQFERRFKEFSGFTPKLFLRIARFNSMLNKPFQNRPLTLIADTYGYHDESHFIHDFRKFSGRNPKEYFNQETIAASDRGTVEFQQ